MSETNLTLGLICDAEANAPAESQVLDWWKKNRQNEESLPATLTRTGFFQPLAERTIQFLKKGFLRNVDKKMLFEPGVWERFRDSIESSCGSASTVVETQSVPVQIRNPNTQLPARDPRIPQIGDVLGRCLLTGIIGKGGYGTVFSALHQTLNMPVAIKVLFATEEGIAQDTKDNLRREAQLLARLAHPNIVRVLDFEDSGIPYVVMEYVEGPSLSDLINQTGCIRVDKATAIMASVVDGLAAGWSHHIVHRDIKPGNILLSRSGEVKLADLGLAFVRGTGDVSQTPGNGNPIGTCAYMAPEQIMSNPTVDFRADIYALGCTYYHAITGSIPFQGKHPREVILKHLQKPLVPPHESHPGLVSAAVSNVIVKMMSKLPEQRYQSYDELKTALTNLSLSQKSETQTQGMQKPSPETTNPTTTSRPRKSGLINWITRR